MSSSSSRQTCPSSSERSRYDRRRTTDAPDTDADETEAADVAPELHGCVLAESCGQPVVHPRGDQYLALVKALDDDGYTMCVDLTVSTPGRMQPPRKVPSPLSMSTVVAVPAFTTRHGPACRARAAISAAQRSGPSCSGRS